MTTLILVEHQGHQISRATLSALRAAQDLNADIHFLITGYQVQQVAQAAARLEKVSAVFVADAPHLEAGLAENVCATAHKLAAQYSHIMVAASSYGKNLAPRLAALLNVAQISDITAVLDSETFERPIYAGNAIATVRSHDVIKVITVRYSSFEVEDKVRSDAVAAPINAIEAAPDTGLTQFVKREITSSDRPELGSARVVVSGGRGLGSKAQYDALLGPLAGKLHAALGASRAAVDAGFAPNDYQVGQTGKIVAPDLYMAIGISGAIQHLAGMKDAKVIVAMNKDPDAPIFSVADYGLVGDLFETVPALLEALQQVPEPA